MDLPQKKTGILLSTAPGTAAFSAGVTAAAAALANGSRVFAYCIDDAVAGIADPELQSLRERGLVLHACAFAAQRRRLPLNDRATFAGLGALGDIIAGTDNFRHFGGAPE